VSDVVDRVMNDAQAADAARGDRDAAEAFRSRARARKRVGDDQKRPPTTTVDKFRRVSAKLERAYRGDDDFWTSAAASTGHMEERPSLRASDAPLLAPARPAGADGLAAATSAAAAPAAAADPPPVSPIAADGAADGAAAGGDATTAAAAYFATPKRESAYFDAADDG